MSDGTNGADGASEADRPFAVSQAAGRAGMDGMDGMDSVTDAGGTEMGPGERHELLRARLANPGDPPQTMARRDRPGGLRAGPYYAGTSGRMAIVQGQIYIVGVILVAQLFLVTVALFELLSGHTDKLWWIAFASLMGFAVALLVALWPQSRLRGF